MYLYDSRHSAKALFLKVVLLRKEEAFILSHFFEFVHPCLIVLLMRNCHSDKDRLFFRAIFDDSSVREDFVIDFREIIILIPGAGFLLGWSHYLQILYYQI